MSYRSGVATGRLGVLGIPGKALPRGRPGRGKVLRRLHEQGIALDVLLEETGLNGHSATSDSPLEIISSSAHTFYVMHPRLVRTLQMSQLHPEIFPFHKRGELMVGLWLGERSNTLVRYSATETGYEPIILAGVKPGQAGVETLIAYAIVNSDDSRGIAIHPENERLFSSVVRALGSRVRPYYVVE